MNLSNEKPPKACLSNAPGTITTELLKESAIIDLCIVRSRHHGCNKH